MSNAYPHLNIPDIELSDEVHALLNKMNAHCEAAQSDSSKKLGLDDLNSAYWQFITAFIPSLITEENKENFFIPDSFQECIDFGAVSPLVCPDYEEGMSEIKQRLDTEKVEYEILYLSEWIKEVYDKVIRLDNKRKVEEELAQAEAELAQFPDKLHECFARRQDFKEKYPQAIKVMQISEEIDDKLPHYLEIKKKIELALRLSAQERTEYVHLTEEITKLREYRAKEQQAISSKVPQHELMRLDREIEQIMVSKREVEERRDKALRACAEDAEFRCNISISFCREKMREELRRIRAMSDLISRRSRVKQCAILVDVKKIPTPQPIAEALEEILEVDQTIFLMDSARKKKFPRIVVLPAFGDGSYDDENNVFYVPVRSLKGLLQSLSSACIEYHLDSQAGGHFRDSYLGLKKNKNINSSIQLRDNVVRDYIGWVTLEAKGYQVLDQETKTWFIENVAPPMFALKHPRHLSVETLPIADVHSFIDKCEKDPDKDENNYELMLRMGIAYWRVRQYIKANYAFLKAVKADGNSKDACYNAALSCFKTGQKTKAREYWRHYLSLDKASFWTVRVQKFLSTVH